MPEWIERRRYVVIGGGAIGGVLAAQLQSVAVARGFELVLVARGDHGRAIADHGLTVRRPNGVDVVELAVATGPDDIDLRVGDVLVLAVKTQDAEAALAAWAWQPVRDERGEVVGAGVDLPIVTYQNGLLTEDLALRRFRRVYGATIAVAASYLTAGEIVLPSLPPAAAVAWLGRHPKGVDALQDTLVADLVAGGVAAFSVDDIVAQKAAKLLGNVGNGLDLLTGSDDDRLRARRLLREESIAVLEAAGVPLPPGQQLDFHGVEFSVLPVPGHVPGRLSTWQSFARGASSEIDYLNGEVVLLARRFDLEAPLNEQLQRLLGSADLGERTLDVLLSVVDEPDRDDVAV